MSASISQYCPRRSTVGIQSELFRISFNSSLEAGDNAVVVVSHDHFQGLVVVWRSQDILPARDRL